MIDTAHSPFAVGSPRIRSPPSGGLFEAGLEMLRPLGRGDHLDLGDGHPVMIRL
jgi:hypothetical protein